MKNNIYEQHRARPINQRIQSATLMCNPSYPSLFSIRNFHQLPCWGTPPPGAVFEKRKITVCIFFSGSRNYCKLFWFVSAACYCIEAISPVIGAHVLKPRVAMRSDDTNEEQFFKHVSVCGWNGTCPTKSLSLSKPRSAGSQRRSNNWSSNNDTSQHKYCSQWSLGCFSSCFFFEIDWRAYHFQISWRGKDLC